MENEILNATTEVATEAVVEKKTTTKKAVVKKAATAKATETLVKQETSKKVKKQYDLHDMVTVRNMTAGSLIYKSNRNLGYIVEWSGYNDEQPMEVLELKNMLASQRRFFEKNWVWIDDPTLIEELGLSKFYKHMLSPEQVDALFEEDVDTMVRRISELSSDMQDTARVVAKEKITNGEITSYTVIQALQKYFGESLTDEE